MKVLLVGDGAREHIIAEQLARSCEAYVAMEKRNPGIESSVQKVFVCDFSNIEAIGGWAVQENIDIALVTSEEALARGLSDALTDIGIAVASPPSAGSEIGENTVYAFNLMETAGIAIPRLAVCKNEQDLKKAVGEMKKVIMKPAVRVEWKGARFSESDFRKKDDMIKRGNELIKRHGSVVLEEPVDGERFSVQAMTDGKTISVMPPVHTARRALDGNGGELTEGMGSYSAGRLLPFMKQSDFDYARDCLSKLVATMRGKGIEYRGAICGQFIAARKGPVMVDVYATLGDMETLNNLMLLRTQFVEVLNSVIEGKLIQTSFMERATVVKYVVPEKYPEKAKKKERITIEERVLWDNGAKAYVDSLELKKDKILLTNERAVAICTSGATVEEAEAKAEGATTSIGGKVRHRKDIATKEYLEKSMKHMAMVRAV